jgi:hypothetical protein
MEGQPPPPPDAAHNTKNYSTQIGKKETPNMTQVNHRQKTEN